MCLDCLGPYEATMDLHGVRRDFKLKVSDSTQHMAFQGNDFPADKYEPDIKFTSKNAPTFTVQLSRYIYSRKREMETLCTYNHSKLKMERIHNRKRSKKVK